MWLSNYSLAMCAGVMQLYVALQTARIKTLIADVLFLKDILAYVDSQWSYRAHFSLPPDPCIVTYTHYPTP